MSTRYWVLVSRPLWERREEWVATEGWRWVQPWSARFRDESAGQLEVEAEDDDPAAAELAGELVQVVFRVDHESGKVTVMERHRLD